MTEQVQTALEVLVGLPLWSAGRAADMEWFHFGERRTVRDFRNRTKEVGEYALHVQCAWRIAQGNRTIIGSRDLYCVVDGTKQSNEDFDWQVLGSNRRDKGIDTLFEGETRQYLVKQANVGNAGDFTISLDGGYALEVFPDDSSTDEHWRIFKPYAEEPHFVVTGEGLKT